MLANPGFTFKTIKSSYKIVPYYEADIPKHGSLYNETIKCVHTTNEMIDVYTAGPGLDAIEDSVAFKFAALDIHNTDSILAFCNQYGLPISEKQFANHTNNYLFFEANKEDFSMVIPIEHEEREWLGSFQKEVVDMRFLLLLNDALRDKNYTQIIEILTFFCFDISRLDYPGSSHNSETFRFNHHFIQSHGVNWELDSECDLVMPFESFSDDIRSFLYEIEEDIFNEEMYNNAGLPYKVTYTDMWNSTWQYLHTIFSKLLDLTEILKVSPFGDVVFSEPPTSDQLINGIGEKVLLTTAQAVISDIFKKKLQNVYPEIRIENGIPTSAWCIPTLEAAMYLEIFFRLTPNGTIKRCCNPTCNEFFEWSTRTPNKKYCSSRCSLIMAKRMQRKRDSAK